MRTRLGFSVTAAICALAFSGCGDNHGLYPVYGKVLCKGEPAAGAIVYFHRKDFTDRSHEVTPIGIVQSDGSFTVTSASLGDGALPGEYLVQIEWREGPIQLGRPPRGTRGKPMREPPDRLKGRYANLKKPRLEAEIKPETNYLSAFEVGD
jgi:hypothetical protein